MNSNEYEEGPQEFAEKLVSISTMFHEREEEEDNLYKGQFLDHMQKIFDHLSEIYEVACIFYRT